MTMIKCPECRHHISSMSAKCPECGAAIDPEWAREEAERELKKLEEVPFTITNLSQSPSEGEELPLPPKKRRGWGWFVVILLLALIIGAIFYYDYRTDCRREQHAYEMLRDCSNPDFYEDFIIRYPKNPHIDEVRQRLKKVTAQQQEWQRLVAEGSRADLVRFVREHPASPYVKIAQGRVDSLDWVEAKNRRTLEAVAQYLSTHPDGYYIDHAEQLRQTLERQRAEALAAQRDSLAADSAQAIAQP